MKFENPKQFTGSAEAIEQTVEDLRHHLAETPAEFDQRTLQLIERFREELSDEEKIAVMQRVEAGNYPELEAVTRALYGFERAEELKSIINHGAPFVTSDPAWQEVVRQTLPRHF